MPNMDDPFHHLHDEEYAAAFPLHASWRDAVAMGGRDRIDLGGDWRFVLDLHDEGLRQGWFRDTPSNPATWTVPRDYDGGDWQVAPVPSCWNVQNPEWKYFEGAAWYTRMVERPDTPDGARIVLRVGAAAHAARIFVEGEYVGGHLGGSTPFFIDLTGHLADGSNRLQIQVDNRRRTDGVPMHHFDWFNYGGLHREVALLVLPIVHIKSVRLDLADAADLRGIRASVVLNAPVDTAARLEIAELGIDAVIQITGGTGNVVIDARPDLWSPEVPRLYDCTVTCGEDIVRERIGFRAVAVIDGEITLNGTPVWLRGVCCHEDDEERGRCTDLADIRRRLQDARDLGANCLRLAHYPHHEDVARLADEIGMMLIGEVPVYWAIDFANPGTLRDAENQLREMIERDANRPSVVMWSIGNENADTDARLDFLTTLVRAARDHDQTRLVTAACLIDRKTFAIADRLARHLDVIGVNEYFGWYEPNMDDFAQLLSNSHMDKPVIISETGAEAVTGFVGEVGTLFSEAHQADVFRQQLDLVVDTPFLKGFFPWLLYDFRSERRQTTYQRGWNLKGLIDRDKTRRKLAFDVIGKVYRKVAGPAQQNDSSSCRSFR